MDYPTKGVGEKSDIGRAKKQGPTWKFHNDYHSAGLARVMDCAPPNSYVDNWIPWTSPNLTIFGDRAFNEVIKVK